jgi:5,10-methylenetetrahydromethanopterin reductase
MSLALAAQATERIGLGPAVLIPSLRHVLVTASAIAQLESLAPGRTAYAFGTGFTGRLAMGQPALPWATVVRYVEDLRALLRGEAVEVEGAMVEMLHGPGQAPARPLDPPFLLAATGPKGRELARRLGMGLFGVAPTPGFEWSAVLGFGTVVDDTESLDDPRVLASAGPGAAVAFHAMYSAGSPVLDQLPGGEQWRSSIEAVPAERRHLETHRGHLTELNEIDRPVMTGSLAAAFTLTGTRAQIAERLAQMEAAGATEIAFQPCGVDWRRELEAFMDAARSG